MKKNEIMKVTTTFWNEKIFTFSELLYYNGKTKNVIFKTNLNDMMNTLKFFDDISKFVMTKQCMKTGVWSSYDDEWFQFAVMFNGEVTPIKWFDLHVGDDVISHDIAFETTLIKKNGFQIPFGKFPRWSSKRKYPKQREFNIKKRAYKYIANRIRSQT